MEKLKQVLVEKLGEEFVLEENKEILRQASVFDVHCRVGEARFSLGNEHIYFFKRSNERIGSIVAECVAWLNDVNVDSIRALDGKKMPLNVLSLNDRTFLTMCTGYMENEVYETIGDVLNKSQAEILTEQKQLGKTGLRELVQVFETLGYELREI